VSGEFWRELNQLRMIPYALRCQVRAIVRVREPLSWYISFFDWAIATRQRHGVTKYGRNFTDWLPPNLQARFLLTGSAEADTSVGSRMPAAGASKPEMTTPRRLSTSQWARLRWIVATADVAAPLERLDEALVLLGMKVPFLATTAYRRHSPSSTRGDWMRKPIIPDAPLSAADTCAGTRRTLCEEAVRFAAPDDADLYKLVVETFERQLAGLHRQDRFDHRLRVHRKVVADIAANSGQLCYT